MTQTRAHSWPQCTNKATIPQPWQPAPALPHLRQCQQVVVWLHPRHAHERGQVHKAQRLQEKQDTGSKRGDAMAWAAGTTAEQQLRQRDEARVSCFCAPACQDMPHRSSSTAPCLHEPLVPLVPLPVLGPHAKRLAPHLAHHILLQALCSGWRWGDAASACSGFYCRGSRSVQLQQKQGVGLPGGTLSLAHPAGSIVVHGGTTGSSCTTTSASLTSTAWSSTSGWQPRHTGCARNARSLCARNACTRVLSASGSTACPDGRSSNCRMKLRQPHRRAEEVGAQHGRRGGLANAQQQQSMQPPAQPGHRLTS